MMTSAKGGLLQLHCTDAIISLPQARFTTKMGFASSLLQAIKNFAKQACGNRNYYLSFDVCACFRPSVRVSFCKKIFFVQNGSNSQIR